MLNWYCCSCTGSPAEVRILWFLYKAALSLNRTITNLSTVFRCECTFYQHKCLQLTQSYKSENQSGQDGPRTIVSAGLVASWWWSPSSWQFSLSEAGSAPCSVVSFQSLWLHLRPSWLSDALSTRLYQFLTLVFAIISSNAWRPSITLRTPYTACREKKMSWPLQKIKGEIARMTKFRIHSFQDFCDIDVQLRVGVEPACFLTRSARLGWSPPMNLLFLPMAATQSLTAL